MRARPAPTDAIRHFALDPAVTFLNHGSFGACPRVVLEEQSRLRARMEAEPMRFFLMELEGLLDQVRGEVAAFVGADAEGLALLPNATTGVNTVLRNLDLGPGDAVLCTDHEYAACRNALSYTAARTGAALQVVPVPFPISGPDEVIDRVLAAVTSQTRFALVDHVTSQTGLILPVERLVPALQARGVVVMVDGAHAPGMVPLNLQALGADYYTGNFHKWVCAPKGAAFLHVREDRRPGLHPLCVSHGYTAPRSDRSPFRQEFDWTGTQDATALLCVPAALRFVSQLLPGGLDALRAHNRALALSARETLAQALGVPLPCPAEMLGSLAALPLPDDRGAPSPALFSDGLHEALLQRYGIQVPIIPWPARPRRVLRVSAQIYNSPAQYEHLAHALRQLL